MLAGLITASNPASAATIRLPKTAMNACVVQNGIYCIESVTLTTGSGQKIPLVYVPSGSEVPAKKTPSDFFAPVAKIMNGKVVDNNWWLSQYQRDVLTSGKMVVMDATALLNTANFPEQGAKYDPVKKTFDINKPLDFFTYPSGCWGQGTKPFKECVKGANIFLLDNQVKFMFFNQSLLEAANANKNFKTMTFVDLADLAALQQRPVNGTTYDATTKKFKDTEGLVIPIWLSQNALINGWSVAGTVAAPAATTTDSTTAVVAPLAPDTATIVSSPTESGRSLPGRWTNPNWQGLDLGALGYDGLYVEARSLSEYTSSQLFIDVVPTLTGADKKVKLAGQVGNKDYAVSLDADLVITAQIRIGEMKTGVTVAVGTDIVTVQDRPTGEYNRLTITGGPVTVPLAKKSADCTGEAGVSKANVRQFQMISLAANDDMSGFGFDGAGGGMYVGTNGVCSISTPTWDEGTKTFSWVAAAPHFAPDGTTVNKGFYKAVIPFRDAELLWGMTKAKDAISALEISLTTEAGGTAVYQKSILVKNGNIIIDVSGFEYSRPKLKIGIKKSYKPATKILNKTTITCIKGKTVKKITAVKPVCPEGYTKKQFLNFFLIEDRGQSVLRLAK